MVKLPHQKHSRNISTVSDISMGERNEPLRRDQKADIKCILLCDSTTEQQEFKKAFEKAIFQLANSANSGISNPKELTHAWDQPHNDCLGAGCNFCTGSKFNPSLNGDSASIGGDSLSVGRNGGGGGGGGNQWQGYHSHGQSYWRFKVDDVFFRVMVLDKEKAGVGARGGLLRTTTYDFLLMAVQVMNEKGEPDFPSWERDWKRLRDLSFKAVAPIVMLGYFRDVMKLKNKNGSPEELHQTITDESLKSLNPLNKRIVNEKFPEKEERISLEFLPRFVDFVWGPDQDGYPKSQLADIFRDMGLLYSSTGFVLQQCAYNNCVLHFSRIIEHKDLTIDDLIYTGEDKENDNPLMIAAKLRNKEIITTVFRSAKFKHSDNSKLCGELIHARNKDNQTLLAMVALQGPELEEQKLLILGKEIQYHCQSSITHSADQIQLQRCLRTQLKTSAEAATILDQSRALQGIPKTVEELSAERCKVWSRLFFASLLVSLLFNAIDTGSDVLIMIRYYWEWVSNGSSSAESSCGSNLNSLQQQGNTTELKCPSEEEYYSSNDTIPIDCYPLALSPAEKFGYTLFFLVVPWPFFIYEFFTSDYYPYLVKKGGQLVSEMSKCESFGSLLLCYLKAIFYCLSFVFCLLLWPVAVLFIKYYSDGKYYLARGVQRAERERHIEMSEVLFSTARVMEVSLESSFQPTIQLYIIFPTLLREMTRNKEYTLQLFTVCTNDKDGSPVFKMKMDQNISIITSIISLAWCFSYYHATLKRGALDRDLAALFYRCVLFLSNLFQILGRLFILVLYSYAWGPYKGYYPMLIFLGCHIVLMSILHFIFSDAKKYWQKESWLNLSFWHYMIGNGLANIYIHNWIRMDPLRGRDPSNPFTKPLQHVSTLCRQLVFDLVFIAENIILLCVAVNSNVKELQEQKIQLTCILLVFCFLGLVLKCVYYRYLHIWAWLIMDYVTEKIDGHWHCTLITNMYFMGEMRENYKLTLCCVPRPIYSIYNFICIKTVGGWRGKQAECTICRVLYVTILAPIAFGIGLVCLSAVLLLIIAFLPVYLVTVFPCVMFVKWRQPPSDNKVKKVTVNERGLVVTDNHDDDDNANIFPRGDGDEAEETIPLKPTEKLAKVSSVVELNLNNRSTNIGTTATTAVITDQPKPRSNGGSGNHVAFSTAIVSEENVANQIPDV